MYTFLLYYGIQKYTNMRIVYREGTEKRMKMGNVNLSDGEWKIMNLLWEEEKTITELTAGLRQETGWDKHIIITMLNRMEKKGAISFKTSGRAKQYFPLVSRNEVSLRETRGFLKKVYQGSIGMMVNAMVEDKALSKEDIAELYEILEQAQREKDGEVGK